MSIAVSVLVKPSRLLFLLVSVMCAGVALIGASIGFGAIDGLSGWVRIGCAVLCMLSAILGLLHTALSRRSCHIDISGAGQIRLRIEIAVWQFPFRPLQDFGNGAVLVKLLPDSTVWPGFMSLRLRAEDGRIYIVPILRDSLPDESFRAVSVACRWIAAHRSDQGI